MQIILNSIQELKELALLIGNKAQLIGESGQAKQEEPKIEIKPAAEKIKNDKTETKKEEQPKVEKAKTEDKRNETSKVEAEIIKVNTITAESPKDVVITEDNKEPETANITKEMVRALCSKAIKAGKSAEVKNIVSKYGASKLPELKEECYADAYKDVEALL